MSRKATTVKRTSRTRMVRVGHTPDMDDAFMFYGIDCGGVETGTLRFEHVVEDIQALNVRARTAALEVTAISAASYPGLAKDYWILAVGSSVGQGYGPLVIAKEPCAPASLVGKPVAIPGPQTTAYLLLSLAIPGIEPVPMRFEEVPAAVLEGRVAAGLVIHEWQLTYRDAGLLPILDLGNWWQQQTKLPLPLGLNCVKRSLGRPTAQRVATILRNSILYAFAHQEGALAYAMRYARGTDPVRARQFIGMYVNDDSLTLSKPCREALRLLYKRAHTAGLIPRQPRLEIIEPAVR